MRAASRSARDRRGPAVTSWCTVTPATDTSAYTTPVTGPRVPVAAVMPCAKFSAAPTAANTTVPSRRCQTGRPG